MVWLGINVSFGIKQVVMMVQAQMTDYTTPSV